MGVIKLHSLLDLDDNLCTIVLVAIVNLKAWVSKKGNKKDPDNYRPITILSCLGKLFTAVLNARLKKYTEENKIIGEEQLGFRNTYSTIDGAFILNSLVEIMQNRNKSIYAAFIDLRKAFPSVSRPLLLQKLSCVGIGTKMYNIIIYISKC